MGTIELNYSLHCIEGVTRSNYNQDVKEKLVRGHIDCIRECVGNLISNG